MTCSDFDECQNVNNGGCGDNASCADAETPGESPTCTCLDGFTLVGQTCTDIDECANGVNGGCHENAACTDAETPGDAPICTCLNGYSGDGVTCGDIDECADGANGGCDENASCVGSNIPGEPPTCECYPGYEGDGFDCVSACAVACNPEDTELGYNGKLFTTPPSVADDYGHDTAIDGNTMMISAPNAGVVYVYQKATGEHWVHVQSLADPVSSDDAFGLFR